MKVLYGCDHVNDTEKMVAKDTDGDSKQLEKAFIMVAHFVCVLFTGFITYITRPGSSLFSWHPFLMTIAFALLMVESILAFSPISSLVLKSERKVKVQYHWIGMVGALVCALLGAFVIWYNKELNNKPHIVSWHGLLGYITVGYVCIQCTAGIFVMYPHLVKSIVPRLADLKLYHATSGLLLYSLVYATFILAMFSDYFVKNVTGTSWYACVACPAILVLVIMTQITTAYVNKSRRYPSGNTVKTSGK